MVSPEFRIRGHHSAPSSAMFLAFMALDKPANKWHNTISEISQTGYQDAERFYGFCSDPDDP
jgi:hypothetical protein